MADSNITKRALATALRELMQEVPFDKIQVAHICERCDMNRKSFYYHFKDKYDLVNWIFDTEFITIAKGNAATAQLDDRWEFIEQACSYFYENRDFYRKALKIKGQNCFTDHFREYCFPLMQARITYLMGDSAVDDFTVSFLSDACLCAIERWLLDKNCMSPKELVFKIKQMVQRGTATIYREIGQTK